MHRRGAPREVLMNQESLQRIDDFLSGSAIELFASHGLRVEACAYGAEGIDSPFAATIGFASDNLRGVLVLTLARQVAVKSLPSSLRSGNTGDEIVADWTGELSNQMLGRLKNRFHAAGIGISLGTPVVFMGKEMRHYSHASPIQRSLHLDEGSILVEFHAEYERDFEIGEAGPGGEAAASEGEVLFF
jgi:CheY-specific phosphatase CheX